jgi:hypothetical protein
MGYQHAIAILTLAAAGLNHPAAAQTRTKDVSSATALDGVWRMVRRTWTSGDSTIIPAAQYAQPGQLMIAGGYYSQLAVTTDTPRPLFPSDRDPTAEERARACNAFYATGGRFVRTDSTVTIFFDQAMHPNVMAEQGSLTQRWRIRGDTLWLERDQVTSADPALARPVVRRTTYLRVQ